MSVEQAQASKIEMEREILQAIQKFEKATKLGVVGIEIASAAAMADVHSNTISVKVTVEL